MLYIQLKIISAMICITLIFLCGCKASFSQLFEYDNDNAFLFNSAGKAIKASEYIQRERSSLNAQLKITTQGEYMISCKDFIYKGNPGDRVFPVYENENFLYLLTEKNSDYIQLLEWNRKQKNIRLYPHEKREAVGIIIFEKLHGIQYMGDEFHCTFFTQEFKQLDLMLRRHYQTENLLWKSHSPDGKHWLVQLFFQQKPSLYVVCNIDSATWRELSDTSPYKPDLTQKKEVFRFIASDGKEISGILSYPPARFGTRNLPLIVFPHGGPQTRSMLVFDPRVEQLTQNGFLVFQPNYRGSIGQGKQFRQAGWKADGIRRALADIADGTHELLRQNLVNPRKTAILGGSWGGYCSLASVMLYPELYKAAISFFGVTDLFSMLHEFLPSSGANQALDRLQYGDISNPTVEWELKKLSPYFQAETIKVPILLYHFKDDKVVSFQQSQNFYCKKLKHGEKIIFINGRGEHGFPTPSAESEAYEQVIRFLKEVFQDEQQIQ